MDPRYPIGKYEPLAFSEEQKTRWLNEIRILPTVLENAIHDLDEVQLQSPYREGGWTIHQLVHHIADSHMNAYIRFKLGLTEHNPVVKSYEEGLWALLEDVKQLPVNISVTLLHALHARWYAAIRDLTLPQWNRTIIHPASGKEMTLWHILGMYAWHGNHHVAHILTFRRINGI
jgi:uncharacterized damage-inducible protein DinB